MALRVYGSGWLFNLVGDFGPPVRQFRCGMVRLRWEWFGLIWWGLVRQLGMGVHRSGLVAEWLLRV